LGREFPVPKSGRLERIPVFLDPPVKRRVDALCVECACSRSVVIRTAVERGLAAATRELRRRHQDRLRDVGTPSGPRASRAPSFLTVKAAVEELRGFGDIVRIDGKRLEPDALRDVLHAFAQTLSILPNDFEDVVDEGLAVVLSGGNDAGDVPEDLDPNRPPD
jgi:hypothetical protein